MPDSIVPVSAVISLAGPSACGKWTRMPSSELPSRFVTRTTKPSPNSTSLPAWTRSIARCFDAVGECSVQPANSRRRSQPPSRLAVAVKHRQMALAVPLFRLRFTPVRQARFTSRVGGGSDFCAVAEMVLPLQGLGILSHPYPRAALADSLAGLSYFGPAGL